MTSRRLPTCIVPGPFWGSPAHVVACLGASDVTNQARLRMLSACVCMLWPSPAVLLRIRLPVHRSLCVWFSLSDALLVQHGPLHSGCAPPNGALCLLGLCSVVLRLVPCFAYWAARILRNGPPQLYFWVLTGFNLPKWTFQVVLRLACLLLFLSVCHTKRLQSVQKWSERVVFLTCKLRHVLPGKKQRAFFFDMWMFTSGSIFLKHDLQQRFPPQRCSLFFVRSTSTSVPALVLTRCVRATILRPWADLSILWMHKSLENHIVLRL